MPCDRYCVITGWMFMNDENEFVEYISGVRDGRDLWDSEEETDPEDYEDYYEPENTHEEVIYNSRRLPSNAVREGLKYTSEDVEATSSYVLVTPCKTNENGELVVPEAVTKPEVLNEKTVTYMFDVVPSDYPEYGVYLGHQGDDEIRYEGCGADRILIDFCAFLILQHLIPGLKAHVFYELVFSVGGQDGRSAFPNVDYGPVQRTQETDVQWGQIADLDDFSEDSDYIDDFELQKQWLKLLTQEGKSDEEILEDAWMGRGNMWVFKHPGIFPVGGAARLAESCPRIQFATLEEGGVGLFEVSKGAPLLALPPELTEIVLGYLPPESMLRFISTTRVLYDRFRAYLDRFTYPWIRRERPWYLPVGPIQCKEGDTEIVRWRDDWQELATPNAGGSENEQKIPWFAYHLACKRSPNVRSRERIWKIVLQLKETLASTSASTLSTVA